MKIFGAILAFAAAMLATSPTGAAGSSSDVAEPMARVIVG
jgi:hypothetical protein